MKSARKLIPALAMLLISAVLMSTASFAWFSMSTSVSATGMQITAKASSVYLLINTGENDTAAEIQAANAKTIPLAITAEDSKVYPAAHETLANATAASTLTNWYYKVADTPGASTSTGEKTTLTSFDGYVLRKTVYITLAAGSNEAANLKVTGATFASNNSATGSGTKTFEPVKVVVASSTAVVELDKSTTSSATVLAASLSDSTVITLDIYIYYDGNNDAVYTNNVANLDGATISLTFGVDQPS